MNRLAELDPAVDVRRARVAKWSRTVLHVYHQGYLGVRAAAAALPGRKLAIGETGSPREAADIVRLLQSSGASRVVFHGMSEIMKATAEATERLCPQLRLFGVYHGNLAQWAYAPERVDAARFLELDATGVYERSHILKPGADQLLRSPSPHLLVNSAPRVDVRTSEATASAVAFLPGSDNVRKNLYTNVVAADLARSVDNIWHYADLSDSPRLLRNSRRLTYRGPDRHMNYVRAARIVLNVTVIDCHPMVDLEANVVGVPSLHANYRLGVLDQHPAELRQQVSDPTNVDEVVAKIESTLGRQSSTVRDEVADFAELMTAESIRRYEEFLGL